MLRLEKSRVWVSVRFFDSNELFRLDKDARFLCRRVGIIVSESLFIVQLCSP